MSPYKIIFWIIGLFLCHLSTAQKTLLTIANEEPFELFITGESTLHDWKVEAPIVLDYPVQISLALEEGGIIDSFSFRVEIVSMDGGRGSSMNKKTYKALKSETQPYITYIQKKPAYLSIDQIDHFKMISTGVVRVAGVDRDIEIEVKCNISDNEIVFSGEKKLKMSDFKIDPPSAMFGQIQTKDNIVIHFRFSYVVNH